MTRRFAMAVLFASSVVYAADPLPTADQIMDRYIEVTGGKAAYEKRRSEIVTAHLEFAAAGLSAKLTHYSAEPDKYYAVMDMPGIGAVEMGVSNGIAWEKSAILGPRIKNGAERAEALREATLNSTANLRKLYPKITVEGIESVDGEECYKLVLQPNEGNPVTMFFQKKSGLVTKMTTIASSQAGEIPATINISDYKNFGGIWAPAKTTQKAAGQEFSIVVDKVDVNPDIPAERFALPDDIKALAAKAGK
jgi:hypothetical protein